jgi:hypothetical protein
MSNLNREDWLTQTGEFLDAEVFTPALTKLGLMESNPLSPVVYSVGFPSHRSNSKVLGTCWTKAAGDGVTSQVYITPLINDSLLVLATQIHERCHSLDDCASGHKGFFKALATQVGLEGKMTSTVAGEALTTYLEGLVELLGPIPHSELDVTTRKTQGSRMLKVECVKCGFKYNASKLRILDISNCAGCDHDAGHNLEITQEGVTTCLDSFKQANQ